MRSLVVVGAALAGVEAARTLRAEGFDGEITVIGAERHRPYDRPPLSKGYLAGDVDVETLALDVDDRDRLILGTRAVSLRPSIRALELSDGTTLTTDGVVLATGAVARTLPSAEAHPLAGVHTLRTLDDADALRKELRPGARLVVVGGGFIGAEVAATAVVLGLDVTVVETQALPLRTQLGETVARALSSLHSRHGVTLITAASVERLTGGSAVTGVRLQDGRDIPADVVVVGVGSRPCVDWLERSGLEISDGILCDATGATSVPHVVAAGDCAAWWAADLGRHQRQQHWTAALAQAPIAARRLLHGPGASAAAAPSPPYVWSDQYDSRIQVAGRPGRCDEVHVVDGSLQSDSFAALYVDHLGLIGGVVAMNQPRLFGRWRRQIGTTHTG